MKRITTQAFPKIKYLGLVIVFQMISCAPHKSVVSESMAIGEEKNTTTHKIAFLNYEAKKTDDEIDIKLINKIIVEGKLKKRMLGKEQPRSGDFYLIQVDEKLEPIEEINIQNPLVRRIEYTNKLKEFVKKEVKLDSAKFSVRIQLNPKSKFIMIKQLDNINKLITIDEL